MAVPRVFKNTNVKEATHEAPLTGEKPRLDYTQAMREVDNTTV